MIYDSPELYLEDSTSIKDKIARIDTLIASMYNAADKAALTGSVDFYSIDDGQSKIQTKYKGVDAIIEQIKGLEKLRTMYMNKINGRVVTLKDRRAFG
jgi:tetrahydromethanopterin S-methyltransferase subunit B